MLSQEENVVNHKLTTVRLTLGREGSMVPDATEKFLFLCIPVSFNKLQRAENQQRIWYWVNLASATASATVKTCCSHTYKTLAGPEVIYLKAAGWTSCHRAPLTTCEQLGFTGI